MINKVYLCDCMDFMKECKDNQFELAIPDPPYENGTENSNTIGGNNKGIAATTYKKYESVRPDSNYFKELFRVSQYQIIWGGNYFISNLYDTPCMIIWDKKNSGNFADCEIAWTSFKTAVRIFRYRWNGMLQENMKNKEIRIHRHQKPVALGLWLLQKYAKPGWKIFDSHVGSGYMRKACHQLGFDFEGCEIDPDYWQAQEENYRKFRNNHALIDEALGVEIDNESLLV